MCPLSARSHASEAGKRYLAAGDEGEDWPSEAERSEPHGLDKAMAPDWEVIASSRITERLRDGVGQPRANADREALRSASGEPQATGR